MEAYFKMASLRLVLAILVVNISVTYAETLFDFQLNDIHGAPIYWKPMMGKAILVVNTASYCGFTDKTMKEMTEFYDGAKKVNFPFEILAFPCNDFGGQEPGSPAEIEEFAKTKYKAKYIITEKVNILTNPHPIWRFIAKSAGSPPKWNFSKYLFNGRGELVKAYSYSDPVSSVVPDLNKIMSEMLGKKTEL